MDSTFNSLRFCVELGQALVAEFDSAGRATTPGLVGSVRENRVRLQLERLLPSGLGVGSGCVIDSYGGTSKQQDVVIFERSLCPVFSLGETAESTFFPCEGVVAVGEVKSVLGGSELDDSMAKIRSVKRLRRHAEVTDTPGSQMSSSLFDFLGVDAAAMCPSGVFVVAAAVLDAAVHDADPTVRECP